MPLPSRLVVPEGADGSRIDVFLARQDPDHSRSRYQRAIAEGRVRLNGRRAKKWDRLSAGDTVEVEPLEPPDAGPRPDASVPFVVVHEDDALLVVDKPAGVPVHPYRPEQTGTLANGLVARYPELTGIGPQPLEPGLVHRIDTDTSGLLVVARTPAAFRALAAQFAERRVEKVYIALVLGSAPATGTITTPIGHHPTDRRRMVVEGNPELPPRSPRPAVTHFAVRRRHAGYTELEVRIETGRMHQIRVHLASIGHPIAGDSLYQTPSDFRRDRLGLSRPFLHAARLAFEHPADGRRVDFTAPLPPDLVTAAARLEEAGAQAALPEAEGPAPGRAGAAGRPSRAKRAKPASRTFIRRPGGVRTPAAGPAPAGGAARGDAAAGEGASRDVRPRRVGAGGAGGWRKPAGEGRGGTRAPLPTPGEGLPRPGEVFGIEWSPAGRRPGAGARRPGGRGAARATAPAGAKGSSSRVTGGRVSGGDRPRGSSPHSKPRRPR